MTHASKKTPTTARQLVAARQARQAPSAPATAPTNGKEPSKEVAHAVAPTNDAYVDQVLDEQAPSGIVGRLAKFDPQGARFVFSDDGNELPKDAVEYAFLGDQTLHGHMRFNGKGVPPTRLMGLLFSDFRLTQDEDLPDRDKSQWELGQDGEPEDPWKYHYHLVLQDTGTCELVTFDTQSKTGIGAAALLIRHYRRMRDSGDVPVMQAGGRRLPKPRPACRMVQQAGVHHRRAPASRLRRQA